MNGQTLIRKPVIALDVARSPHATRLAPPRDNCEDGRRVAQARSPRATPRPAAGWGEVSLDPRPQPRGAQGAVRARGLRPRAVPLKVQARQQGRWVALLGRPAGARRRQVGLRTHLAPHRTPWGQGHLFEGGPGPTGLKDRDNDIALRFVPDNA